MTTYPRISHDVELSLKLIRQFVQEDPNYLSDAECPYSDDLKDLFLSLTAGMDFEDAENQIDWSGDIEEQIIKLMNEMEKMGQKLGALSPAEKLNFFKTKTNLMEKLLDLREQSLNIKQLSEFRSSVVETLELICTKDQINDFMTAIAGKLEK